MMPLHYVRSLYGICETALAAAPKKNTPKTAPTVGLEPTTTRLRALRSTD